MHAVVGADVVALKREREVGRERAGEVGGGKLVWFCRQRRRLCRERAAGREEGEILSRAGRAHSHRDVAKVMRRVEG